MHLHINGGHSPDTMVSRQRHSGSSSAAAASRGAGAAGGIPTVTSREVMAGREEICIDHHGEIYRLRITNSGKLILTK